VSYCFIIPLESLDENHYPWQNGVSHVLKIRPLHSVKERTPVLPLIAIPKRGHAGVSYCFIIPLNSLDENHYPWQAGVSRVLQIRTLRCMKRNPSFLPIVPIPDGDHTGVSHCFTIRWSLSMRTTIPRRPESVTFSKSIPSIQSK
jgi:hypothetical protein